MSSLDCWWTEAPKAGNSVCRADREQDAWKGYFLGEEMNEIIGTGFSEEGKVRIIWIQFAVLRKRDLFRVEVSALGWQRFKERVAPEMTS